MLQQLLLIATLLPSVLAVTTVQAILLPPNAAASVLTIADGATTYSIRCTSACTVEDEKNQATLVNGPSTAGLTQIVPKLDRTIIIDCRLSPDQKGDCTTKGISAGETRTIGTEILTFSAAPIVITGGLEKLGYVVVETTMEVNTTVVQRKTSSIASSTGTASVTLTESRSNAVTSAASTATKTSSVTATANSKASAIGPGVTADSSTAAAAPTMKAELVGGVIVGLAGILLAVL